MNEHEELKQKLEKVKKDITLAYDVIKKAGCVGTTQVLLSSTIVNLFALRVSGGTNTQALVLALNGNDAWRALDTLMMVYFKAGMLYAKENPEQCTFEDVSEERDRRIKDDCDKIKREQSFKV